VTLYLDTSSLVKLYTDEPGSERVRAMAAGADLVATSSITYAEVRSAFARVHRDKRVSSADYAQIKRRFEKDWSMFISITAADSLIETAGDLAEEHGLYGCDAIQLASFVQLLQGSQDEDVEFSSFDDRLNKAARSLG
jgi:predicted nucleic acid-binding protein